jgi:hypothetical protein
MKSVSLLLNRSPADPSGMPFSACRAPGPSAQASNPAAKRQFDKCGTPFSKVFGGKNLDTDSPLNSISHSSHGHPSGTL